MILSNSAREIGQCSLVALFQHCTFFIDFGRLSSLYFGKLVWVQRPGPDVHARVCVEGKIGFLILFLYWAEVNLKKRTTF